MRRYLNQLMPSHYLVMPDLNSEFKPEDINVSSEVQAISPAWL